MTADDLETTYDTVFVVWRDELFKWIGRSKARDWMDEARLFSVSFSGHFIGLCFKESLVLCNPCLAVLPRVSRTPSVDSWRDRTAEKKLRSFYVSAGSFMANDLWCWFKRHRVLCTCRQLVSSRYWWSCTRGRFKIWFPLSICIFSPINKSIPMKMSNTIVSGYWIFNERTAALTLRPMGKENCKYERVRLMVKSVSVDPKKHQHDLHRLLLSV